MFGRYVVLMSLVLSLAGCAASAPPAAGPSGTYRLALVALIDDPAIRAAFEDGLAAKLAASNYDAVPSHTMVPDAAALDDAGLVTDLAGRGMQGIVMMRPTSVGPGATLESVKNEISPAQYQDMRAFARAISPGDGDELVAVVHTAFYVIKGKKDELLSSGAVWLDEPVASRDEGIDKLQDLIVANMNRARPAVRQHLGLPPIR